MLWWKFMNAVCLLCSKLTMQNQRQWKMAVLREHRLLVAELAKKKKKKMVIKPDIRAATQFGLICFSKTDHRKLSSSCLIYGLTGETVLRFQTGVQLWRNVSSVFLRSLDKVTLNSSSAFMLLCIHNCASVNTLGTKTWHEREGHGCFDLGSRKQR